MLLFRDCLTGTALEEYGVFGGFGPRAAGRTAALAADCAWDTEICEEGSSALLPSWAGRPIRLRASWDFRSLGTTLVASPGSPGVEDTVGPWRCCCGGCCCCCCIMVAAVAICRSPFGSPGCLAEEEAGAGGGG